MTPKPEETPTPEPTSTPEVTIEPTPGLDTPYILHVECKGDTLGPGRLVVSMSYSGDYSGSYIKTPFVIGPYSEPFTVTITAPNYGYVSGLFIFYRWLLDGSSVSSSQSITVTVNAEYPERVISALYYDDMAAMTPTPTQTP